MIQGNKKALIWGGVFGLVSPFIGLFIGLQVSAVVANFLMFPILGLSMIVSTPMGEWGLWHMLLGLVVSVVVWALVFAAASVLVKRT